MCDFLYIIWKHVFCSNGPTRKLTSQFKFSEKWVVWATENLILHCKVNRTVLFQICCNTCFGIGISHCKSSEYIKTLILMKWNSDNTCNRTLWGECECGGFARRECEVNLSQHGRSFSRNVSSRFNVCWRNSCSLFMS